jgi:hypothetical protein
MQNCLDITIVENGNLSVKATTDGIEYLRDQVENILDTYDTPITWKQIPIGIWAELLEAYTCNGSYNLVPAGTFALTDDSMPIIADVSGDYENEYGEV